jgi:hypothetical protein
LSTSKGGGANFGGFDRGVSGSALEPRLFFHLPQSLIELRLTFDKLPLTHQPRIPLTFLSEQNRFLRRIRRLLGYISLPKSDTSADYAESHKCYLGKKNSALNRTLLMLVSPLLHSFSVAGGVLTLRWGGQDDNPPFLMRWGLLAIFTLVGQWSVFEFLKRMFGGMLQGDETRIPRRTEGRGEFRAAGAPAVFQAPKVANPKRPARKPIRRKKSGSDKG